MSKQKLAAVKLFDNRNPQIHTRCGRQERWCSCFFELTNQASKLKINSVKVIHDHQKPTLNQIEFSEKHNSYPKLSDNESNSSKENDIFHITEEVSSNNLQVELENKTNTENKLDANLLLTDSMDITSNSITNNCPEFDISSLEDTSNSSWNELSHLRNVGNQRSSSPKTSAPDSKALRNTFPTVFNKSQLPHMNMCCDRDDIVIPIRYIRKVNDTESRLEVCATSGMNESSTDYDLDTDRLNTSLIENPVKSFNSITSRNSGFRSSVSDKTKKSFMNGITKKQMNESGRISLNVYIADIKGVEESLVLNKDRRFSRILERYNCKASIVQMKNLSRGFPHTLLKIECESKVNLRLMARDTDKIHLNWNLRSQLRSIHA